MNVFQNSLVSIELCPETDSLLVEWPNIEPYTASEVMDSIKKVMEVLTYFNVKNLVIDANKTRVNISYSEYLDIIKKLMSEVNNTQVKKVARIFTPDPQRESVIETSFHNNGFRFELQSFRTRAEANKWLKKS